MSDTVEEVKPVEETPVAEPKVPSRVEVAVEHLREKLSHELRLPISEVRGRTISIGKDNQVSLK